MFEVLFQVGFQGVEPKSMFSRIKESIQGFQNITREGTHKMFPGNRDL